MGLGRKVVDIASPRTKGILHASGHPASPSEDVYATPELRVDKTSNVSSVNCGRVQAVVARSSYRLPQVAANVSELAPLHAAH
jgi:hypothetical protein